MKEIVSFLDRILYKLTDNQLIEASGLIREAKINGFDENPLYYTYVNEETNMGFYSVKDKQGKIIHKAELKPGYKVLVYGPDKP